MGKDSLIVIYGMPGCPTCQKTVALAEEYSLRYTYKDATIPEHQQEFVARFPNENRVPQVVWSDKHIGGYNEFLNEIADTRNYGDGPL